MEFSKYTGKTLEEAIRLALEDKQCPEDELTYEVIEEKAGFLGLGKTVTIEAYCREDVANFIADYIDTYFTNAGLDGDLEVEIDDEDFYRIYVNTNSNALLIGKGGKTLQDFNRLVQAAASSVFKKHIRLMIDINGYKKEKYDKLVRMAIRVAKEVRRTHIDTALQPMPADERKAIHDAIGKMSHVSTKSEGEGLNRAIHILYTPEDKD